MLAAKKVALSQGMTSLSGSVESANAGNLSFYYNLGATCAVNNYVCSPECDPPPCIRLRADLRYDVPKLKRRHSLYALLGLTFAFTGLLLFAP